MKKIIFIILISIITMTNKCYAPTDYPPGALWGYPGLLGNTVISILNLDQISNYNNYGILPKVGLFTGTAQVGIGVYMALYGDDNFLTTGSFIVGLTTIGISIWNLATNHKPKDTRTSWNIYSFPTHDKTMGMGLSYSYRF